MKIYEINIKLWPDLSSTNVGEEHLYQGVKSTSDYQFGVTMFSVTYRTSQTDVKPSYLGYMVKLGHDRRIQHAERMGQGTVFLR